MRGHFIRGIVRVIEKAKAKGQATVSIPVEDMHQLLKLVNELAEQVPFPLLLDATDINDLVQAMCLLRAQRERD